MQEGEDRDVGAIEQSTMCWHLFCHGRLDLWKMCTVLSSHGITSSAQLRTGEELDRSFIFELYFLESTAVAAGCRAQRPRVGVREGDHEGHLGGPC